LFARCFPEEDTSDVVEKVIIPDLQKLRTLDRNDLEDIIPYIDKLIAEASALKKLPLFLGHFDLNDLNFLVEDDAEVTGIVDWELSPGPQPFGIGYYCIPFLAGGIIDGVFREREAFEVIDRAFWEALLENVFIEIRKLLLANLEAVQTSMLIGMLFRIMPIEGGKVLVNRILLKSVHKLMRYRIPMIRGSSRAYAI
jgi:hypothetical protein